MEYAIVTHSQGRPSLPKHGAPVLWLWLNLMHTQANLTTHSRNVSQDKFWTLRSGHRTVALQMHTGKHWQRRIRFVALELSQSDNYIKLYR